MSELDRLGRRHATDLKTVISEREVPELDTEPRSPAVGRGLAVALAAAGLVLILALPVLLLNGTDPVSTLPVPSPSTSLAPATTDGLTEISDRGWEFVEVGFEVREGASYAAGDGLFLAWGGAPDRSGQLRADGLIARISDRAVSHIPDAPIEGRYAAAAVRTPDGFIIFGGHSFETSFVDGAIFDVTTSSWRTITPAPLDPAAYPAAVWTGTEVVVWLAGDDSPFASLPAPARGQIAAYDPSTDSWRTLEAPSVEMVDATLLYRSGDHEIVLVGGPSMRDLGSIGTDQRLVAITYDLAADEWSEPILVGSPITDTARATIGPGDAITVLTSPTLYMVENEQWRAVGPLHHCPAEIDATSGGGTVYLKGLLDYSDAQGCTTKIFNGSIDTMTPLLESDAYGQIGSSFGSGFVASDDGILITLGDADGPRTEGTSGTAILGIYTPDQ